MINITFPDGNVRQYESGTSAFQIAESISSGLARNVVSATVNGQLTDRDLPLTKDATLALHTWNDQQGKETFWHSTAHLMSKRWRPSTPASNLATAPPVKKASSTM